MESTMAISSSIAASFSSLLLPRLSAPSPPSILPLKPSPPFAFEATRRLVARHVALVAGVPSSSSMEDDESENVGRRVRVRVPVKVYHVRRVAEIDLMGLEGEIKQYVGVWKGKRVSASFPFKVEFLIPGGCIDGDGGPVRFFAHLRENEFEFLMQD